MYIIREAVLDDCPGIAEVQVDSYRTGYAGLFPKSYLEQFSYAEQTQDWQDLLTTSSEDILLVAVTAEKQVIGYTLARAKPDIFPGYDAEIVALHVRQLYQHQGIGRALLKEAVGKLSERQCRSVMLWTLKGNPIRRWYESLRGQIIGEKSYQVEDWEVVEIAYGWKKIAALS